MCFCYNICVLLSSYVFLLYYLCIVVILCVFVILSVYCWFTLNAGLLARGPEGPAAGHLDTCFS